MPGWMLRGCVTHAMRTAFTPAGRTSVALHETAWGFTDGYADEILRRRAESAARISGQTNAS